MRVSVGGIELAAHDTGPSDGQPVLLLHGLGGTTATWAEFAAELAGHGRRAVSVDLRGHGESSWPGTGYDFGTMAADLVDFIEALELAPADIVGHSLGGRVALDVAMRRPELVRRLVLEEAPPARHTPTAVDLPKRPDEPTPFDWEVVSPIRHEARAVDPAWWERLANVPTPTLWVVGGASSHVPQDLFAEAAARMIDARLVTVDGGGHTVHQAAPDRFSAAVLPFLLG